VWETPRKQVCPGGKRVNRPERHPSRTDENCVMPKIRYETDLSLLTYFRKIPFFLLLFFFLVVIDWNLIRVW
jgi:hypothetical protein